MLAGSMAPRSYTVAATMGLVFFLLAFVFSIPFETRGIEPSTANADSIRAHYRENAGSVRAYTLLAVAGWATFLWFLAALWTRFGPVAASLATATMGLGVGVAILQTFWAVASGAIAFADLATLPDGAVLAWYTIGAQLGNVGIELTTFFRGLFLLAAGSAFLSTRTLPAWLAWATIVLGALAAVAGFGLATDAAKAYATPPGFVSHILFYPWVGVVGGILAWRSIQGANNPEGAAPAPTT